MATLYQHQLNSIDGQETTLEAYRGKVLLLVNTASKCGFTPQYHGLEALYEKYRDRGLVVLGFPCNQFRNQEPGDEAEIREFCSTRYEVSFPMFAKLEVNGEHAHPLYEQIKREAPGIFGSTSIKWNFTKFLVDRNGRVVRRFAPKTPPERLEKAIEELL
jgi:glutathione peroxidase